MIVDPMGQWKHPGENTRIPGNNITMKGVNYPVLGVGSNGQEQMMYPGQDYQFPGASYVDEYPQMRRGGVLPKAQYGKSYGCGPGTQWNPMTKTCVPIPRPTLVSDYDDPRYQRFLELENLYNFSLLDNFNQRYSISPQNALYGDFSEWDQEKKDFQTFSPNEPYPSSLDDDDSTGPYDSATIEKIKNAVVQANKNRKISIESRKLRSEQMAGKSWGKHKQTTKDLYSKQRKGISLKERHGTARAEEIKNKIKNSTKGLNAKTYNLGTNPLVGPNNQEIFSIINLEQFCRDHKLTSSHIRSVIKGKLKHHKNWRLKYQIS
jgi:hypothetical protein